MLTDTEKSNNETTAQFLHSLSDGLRTACGYPSSVGLGPQNITAGVPFPLSLASGFSENDRVL